MTFCRFHPLGVDMSLPRLRLVAVGLLASASLLADGLASATPSSVPSAPLTPTIQPSRTEEARTAAGIAATAGHTVDETKAGTCDRRRNRLRCRIYSRYIAWSSYLILYGRANPDARWTKRERRYLRNHPAMAKQIGTLSIFRHPGKRGFQHRTRVRRDRRAGLALGGGPNYCTTLTISRLVESSIFQWDLFTARHKVRWCWDNSRVYDYNDGNWTEIEVHDRSAVDVRGEISSHEGDLPTRGDWYTSQQYNICNCAFRIGTISYWQPLWRVWAAPAGKYRWKAHW
jgi:hypothetical protein